MKLGIVLVTAQNVAPKKSNWSSNVRCHNVYLLADPQIWRHLKEQSTQARNPNVICDVYDGKEYLRYHDFLSKPENLSLVFNTDGVALFRSSQVSIWPIWILINELPPSQRSARDCVYIISCQNYLKYLNFRFLKNMLLVGIWYSREKPTMTTFLKPFIDSVNSLLENGIYQTGTYPHC